MLKPCNLTVCRLMITLCLCLAVVGCSKHLDTRYATTRGDSINGISCFIQLLKQSGRRVDLWPGLSSKMMDQYDTLIVVQPSYATHCHLLNEHLGDLADEFSPLQVLVVLRDSDEEVVYWRKISERSDLKPEKTEAARQSYQRALTEWRVEGSQEMDVNKVHQFSVKRVNRSEDQFINSVSYESAGEPKAVDACWPLNRQLVAPESAKILWKSGDEPLLIKEENAVGEYLVLASATPLLNGGLVDKGNRVLTSELIRMIPEGGRVAIALSPYWIEDLDVKSPGILEFFKVHPNGWVFSQALLALLLFCWWKFPIFGRPRVAINMENARFGRHVEAFGRLLRHTQDTDFARRRIRAWQETQNMRQHPDTQAK